MFFYYIFMSEQGDFELFNGPAPSEQKEMSDEQFKEAIKKGQQKAQQIKKEEGKSKKNDDKLSNIIIAFLNDKKNTDLFLLISRNVAQDVTSALIIAILSLIDQNSESELYNLLKSSDIIENKHALTVYEKSNFGLLSDRQKKDIDAWTNNIYKLSLSNPHKTLNSILLKDVKKELSNSLIQLSAFILRKYLFSQNINIDFQEIYDFMQNIWVNLSINLEKFIKNQKQIEE